jgi:hypothetical protein
VKKQPSGTVNGELLYRAFQAWLDTYTRDYNPDACDALREYLSMIRHYDPHASLCRAMSKFIVSRDPPAFNQEFRDILARRLIPGETGVVMLLDAINEKEEILRYCLWRREMYSAIIE